MTHELNSGEGAPGGASAGARFVRHGGWAVLIVLMAGLALYLARRPEQNRVQPAQPPPANELHDAWRVPSASVRKRLYQDLARFQESYKSVDPAVTLVTSGDGPGLEKAAQELDRALRRYALGQYRRAPARRADAPPGILLHYGPGGSTMAQKLWAALTPYLAGTFRAREDAALDNNEFRVTLSGTPRFTGDGRAVFR
jgi:hypothetical protein